MSVPLPAVDLIKQVTADFVTDELKGIVKGAARGDDAEAVVEHRRRIADGIDDGIRERDSVFYVDEWCLLRQRRR